MALLNNFFPRQGAFAKMATSGEVSSFFFIYTNLRLGGGLLRQILGGGDKQKVQVITILSGYFLGVEASIV